MNNLLAILNLVVVGYWIVRRLNQALRQPLPLPPGPPGDPIFGHLRTLPSVNPELVYHEWAKTYGDVIHLNCLGQHIIILDSDQAAMDLLERRGTLYSDRPDIIVYDLMNWNPAITFMRYGNRWRFHRKLFHSYFTQPAIQKFQPMQLSNAYLLAQGLVENKGNFDLLLGRFSTAIAIQIGYGHQILSDEDEYIKLADNAGIALRSGGPAGGTLVDFFPLLRYLPSWFPGTHFANVARQWRSTVDDLYHIPYKATMMRIEEGTAPESFLSSYMATHNGPLSDQEDTDLRGVAALIYGAGAETVLPNSFLSLLDTLSLLSQTWSSLSTFVLAMLVYPECQKLGQEEVDRVIGKERLPTFEDRTSLPFINAIVEEVLRWNPALPLGVLHRATHDDIYRGMFIPKDSYVFTNSRGISRDDAVYRDPQTFNPTRFLPNSESGGGEPPFGAAFGYGRRICPGRHLARASLYIAIATVFSTIHLSRAKDKDGNEIIPKIEFTSGLSSHPKPFACEISLRSEKAKALIDAEVEMVHHG